MNSSEKLEKTQCRTCYKANKGLKYLTKLTKCGSKNQQKSYAEIISELSNINVMDDCYKELPQFICDACLRKLRVAHAFIQQIQDVNERFITILTGLEETNTELNCLQEAQVDIQSCLEIKVEHDHNVQDELTDSKCHLKQEAEEGSTGLKSNYVDALCEENESEKTDNFGLVSFENKNIKLHPSVNDVQKIKTADIFKSNTPSESCLTETQRDQSVRSDVVDDDDKIGMESQSEEDKEFSANSNEEKKTNLKKSKNSKKKVLKPPEDNDVAVICTQCNKIFSNSKALTRHQRNSHIPEDKKCTCPKCFRKFSRSCNMYTHMRIYHGSDTVPLIRKPSTQERTFQCNKCPRKYTTEKHLDMHMKKKHIHESDSEKNISKEDVKLSNDPKRCEVRSLCSICGTSFSRQTHFIIHMRRHTGEYPFKCDFCDRAYPRMSELKSHRRIHTGEKPFVCKICGKAFRVSSKMSRHMRSHSDIRPYKCTQCERSFKYSKDLSIHFRIHTGERPYSCNVCGSTFTQSNSLKTHRLNLGHNDLLVNDNNLV